MAVDEPIYLSSDIRGGATSGTYRGAALAALSKMNCCSLSLVRVGSPLARQERLAHIASIEGDADRTSIAFVAIIRATLTAAPAPVCENCGHVSTVRLQHTIRGEQVLLGWTCVVCSAEWPLRVEGRPRPHREVTSDARTGTGPTSTNDVATGDG